MLIDEICELRDKLNKSILTKDYEYTYELSIKLDELIAEYYKQQKNVIIDDTTKYQYDNKNYI